MSIGKKSCRIDFYQRVVSSKYLDQIFWNILFKLNKKWESQRNNHFHFIFRGHYVWRQIDNRRLPTSHKRFAEMWRAFSMCPRTPVCCPYHRTIQTPNAKDTNSKIRFFTIQFNFILTLIVFRKLKISSQNRRFYYFIFGLPSWGLRLLFAVHLQPLQVSSAIGGHDVFDPQFPSD